MRLTDRDLELVRSINRFGFLTLENIVVLWGVDFSTAAARVRKLIELGVIRRLELQHFEARPLIPTKSGCSLAGETMAPLKGVRVSTFVHDKLLFELATSLEARFSAHFETEREYRLRAIDRVSDFHVPDGILHRGDTHIGIELELSKKAPRRLTEIISSHAANLAFDEVWYIVLDESLRTHVQRIAGAAPHVKVVKWTSRHPSRTLSQVASP